MDATRVWFLKMRASSVRVEVAWNAKPCSEWEASQEGRRDIEGYEAEAASIAKAEGRAA